MELVFTFLKSVFFFVLSSGVAASLPAVEDAKQYYTTSGSTT
jgi:hypothetical protein